MTAGHRPMRWSPGAAALMEALRSSSMLDGFLFAEAAFAGLTFRTPLGGSIASSLLRDRSFGLDPAYVVGQSLKRSGVGHAITDLELEIETSARGDGVRIVGERHVVGVVIARFQGRGQPHLVDGERLLDAVRARELGPGFERGEIEGRWHGLLDTSIIIQGKDLWAIDWATESKSKAVVLWAGLSLLNGLDGLGYSKSTDRVHRRVTKFAKWLAPLLDEATGAPGHALRPGIYLRVWGQPSVVGARDTDHLETAEALRERGVDAVMITRDLGMIGRAKLLGIPVHWLDERGLLPSPPEE